MVNKQVAMTSKVDSEIDLSALINLLKSGIWILAIGALISLSCATLYMHHLVPQYQSDVLLQVDGNRNNTSSVGSISDFLTPGNNGGYSVDTQMALIKSRFILDQVIKGLNLDINIRSYSPWYLKYFFPQKLTSKNPIIVSVFDVPDYLLNKSFQLRAESPRIVSLFDAHGQLILRGSVGKLLFNKQHTIQLQVTEVKGPIGVNFLLTKNSKAIVINKLLGKLKIEEVNAGRRANSATGLLNMSLIGENPKKIMTILNRIATITQSEDAKKNAREASKTLEFLYQQLPIAKGELEKAEYQLNQYRAKSGKIDAKLQDRFLLNQLIEKDKKLEKLHMQQLEMSQRYTPKHPMFISLTVQIKELEEQRVVLERTLKNLPESQQVDINLKRDISVKQTLYLVLLNKIQELQVVKAGTISSIRILSPATLPDAPVPQHGFSVYFGTLILGLSLTLIGIFGRRLVSPRIEDPQWSERSCGIPTLAIVPYSKVQQDRPVLGSKQVLLLAHTHPKNLTIEAVRSLRTSLQVSLAGTTNNIVSILGAAPGVGKSFISVNLAYLLAAGGKKVILVDADLRRGTLHKYMNGQASPGLADVLNQQQSLDTAICPTVHENLDYLARGTYPQDPSELLMNIQFKVLMDTLSQRYDIVIVDTAPILLVTDAVIVSSLAGVNYIVFGAGAHEPSEIELAVKRLSDAGVQLNGSIFNFYKEKKKLSTDYYGYYYRRNYSYYYNENSKTKA